MWQKAIKKCLFTLAIDNWQPEITARTFPLMRMYARKMGAEFYVIKDRKYPEWPITYEKLQIYNLAQEMGNDWNMFLDADALVHPETPDFTFYLSKSMVAHHGSDKATTRWSTDQYFLRDGRDISSCNWCTIASDLCLDIWHPVDDMTPQEVINRCHPTVHEELTVITPDHLIDDFILSRNIARYGLKFTTLLEMMPKIGHGDAFYFWHQYTIPPDQKTQEIDNILRQWRLI